MESSCIWVNLTLDKLSLRHPPTEAKTNSKCLFYQGVHFIENQKKLLRNSKNKIQVSNLKRCLPYKESKKMTEEQQVPTLGACYSKVYVLQRKIRNGLNRTFTVPYFSQDCPDQVLTNNRHHLGKKNVLRGQALKLLFIGQK